MPHHIQKNKPQGVAIEYRPEIDGLRAISILLVMLFHFDFSFISGGFVGVDVFFVISGYLIYAIVTEEQEAGTFSLSNFLFRRARRLAPAYFLTLLICLIVSFIILSPSHFERFAGAYLYSLFGLTNLFLFGETGYFDTSVIFKPLIHLWSLSVEVQFYFLFAMIMLIPQARNRQHVLLLFTVASLLTAIILHSSNYDYYFTPSRLYEFAVGAFAFRLRDWFARRSSALNNMSFGAGLLLILCAATTFDQQTPMPSISALIPCIGAGLVIVSHPSRPLLVPLVHKTSVELGKISYALYLIHWPLWVYFNYIFPTEPTEVTKLALIVGSICLSIGIYQFVELPFRKSFVIGIPPEFNVRLTRHRLLYTSALLAIVFSIPLSASIWTSGGWPWRFNSELAQRIDQDVKLARKQWRGILKDPGNLDLLGEKPMPGLDKDARVLVVGDSHSKDLFVGLVLARNQLPNLQLARISLDESCFPATFETRSWIFRAIFGDAAALNRRPECSSQLANFEKAVARYNPTHTIIANHWSTESLTYLEHTVKYHLKLSTGKLVLWGNVGFPFHIPTLALVMRGVDKINTKVYGMNRMPQVLANKQLDRLAKANGIAYVDVMSSICRPTLKECLVADEQGQLLFVDKNHFSIAGLLKYQEVILKSVEDLAVRR